MVSWNTFELNRPRRAFTSKVRNGGLEKGAVQLICSLQHTFEAKPLGQLLISGVSCIMSPLFNSLSSYGSGPPAEL